MQRKSQASLKKLVSEVSPPSKFSGKALLLIMVAPAMKMESYLTWRSKFKTCRLPAVPRLLVETLGITRRDLRHCSWQGCAETKLAAKTNSRYLTTILTRTDAFVHSTHVGMTMERFTLA
jgi:hypothetical protein